MRNPGSCLAATCAASTGAGERYQLRAGGAAVFDGEGGVAGSGGAGCEGDGDRATGACGQSGRADWAVVGGAVVRQVEGCGGESDGRTLTVLQRYFVDGAGRALGLIAERNAGRAHGHGLSGRAGKSKPRTMAEESSDKFPIRAASELHNPE